MSLPSAGRYSLVLLVAAVSFACSAIAAESKAVGSKLRGTYQNSDGMTLVEFQTGGKAFFSFHGLTQECTHKQDGKRIVLTCDGEETAFTVADDGALAGPPESFVARMKKKP